MPPKLPVIFLAAGLAGGTAFEQACSWTAVAGRWSWAAPGESVDGHRICMNFIPGKRISMRDIAKAVGVSVSAVSLALKNSPRVSEPVRNRIAEKIRELGYQPDPVLKALCHYRRAKVAAPFSAELAWVNAWRNPKALRSFGEFELYWQGAFEEAKRCGFRLEEFRLQECGSFARLEQILRARNIHGILIPPHGALWPSNWEEFQWQDFSVVRFGHSVTYPRAHLVTSDQLTDGMLAFECMWNKGYRRIAFVTTRDTTIRGTRFSAGFLLGQLKVGTKARLYPLLMSDRKNLKEDQEQLRAWLRKMKPDAILTDCQNLHRLLNSCGYQVPDNVGLATTSVLDGGVGAGIDQNSREIGKAAVQMLISQIDHNERGIPEVCRELLIEGRWVDGETLPERKAPGPDRLANSSRPLTVRLETGLSAFRQGRVVLANT